MSKFGKIVQANRESKTATVVVSDVPLPVKQELVKADPKSKNSKRRKVEVGEFTQIGAYIPKELYWEVKAKLIARRGELDFSDLVGELLTDWVNSDK